jgi:RNA polymerase sigma-70 factor (ECF subfamily)
MALAPQTDKPSIIASLASSVALRTGLSDDDAPLIRRCRVGDMDAFGLLVARHERRVMGILTRILGGADHATDIAGVVDIEDMAQEVFLQAWRALPSFRGDARFATWLYRIATNRALKEWHRVRRGSGRVQGTPVPEEILRHLLAGSHTESLEHDPEKMLQTQARDAALGRAIDSLPEKQRVVILLHYFEEYSCEDIARIQSCSVGTVWSRLHYACRRLRENLDWLVSSEP